MSTGSRERIKEIRQQKNQKLVSRLLKWVVAPVAAVSAAAALTYYTSWWYESRPSSIVNYLRNNTQVYTGSGKPVDGSQVDMPISEAQKQKDLEEILMDAKKRNIPLQSLKYRESYQQTYVELESDSIRAKKSEQLATNAINNLSNFLSATNIPIPKVRISVPQNMNEISGDSVVVPIYLVRSISKNRLRVYEGAINGKTIYPVLEW